MTDIKLKPARVMTTITITVIMAITTTTATTAITAIITIATIIITTKIIIITTIIITAITIATVNPEIMVITAKHKAVMVHLIRIPCTGMSGVTENGMMQKESRPTVDSLCGRVIQPAGGWRIQMAGIRQTHGRR